MIHTSYYKFLLIEGKLRPDHALWHRACALGVNAIRWCGEYDRLYTAGRDSIIRKWSLQDDEASGDFPRNVGK